MYCTAALTSIKTKYRRNQNSFVSVNNRNETICSFCTVIVAEQMYFNMINYCNKGKKFKTFYETMRKKLFFVNVNPATTNNDKNNKNTTSDSKHRIIQEASK